MAHKEFMLKFKTGQEYLISVPKLRWKYQHLPLDNRPSKDVDATLSAAEFVRRWCSIINGHYTFFYNGKEIHNFTINSYQDPNLVILDIDEPFPGYAPGHNAREENRIMPEPKDEIIQPERITGQFNIPGHKISLHRLTYPVCTMWYYSCECGHKTIETFTISSAKNLLRDHQQPTANTVIERMIEGQ